MTFVETNLNEFTRCELAEAGSLLNALPELDAHGKIEICRNNGSGYVFLCDEDYRVWMTTSDGVEEFYSCPYCGHEGFKSEMNHEPEHSDCTEYLQQIGLEVQEE